jgi:hypothetical protein
MQYTGLMRNRERRTNLNTRRYGINLSEVLIGVLTYNLVFVPVCSFMILRALPLDGEYWMPINLALAAVGIYVTENFACRNVS